MMTTDLHHAGALLNPYLLDDINIHEDAAVTSGFMDAMRRLTTGIDGHYARVVAEFQSFKERRGAPICLWPWKPIYHPTSGGTSWAKVAHTWPLWRNGYWPKCAPLRRAKGIGVVTRLCTTRLETS